MLPLIIFVYHPHYSLHQYYQNQHNHDQLDAVLSSELGSQAQSLLAEYSQPGVLEQAILSSSASIIIISAIHINTIIVKIINQIVNDKKQAAYLLIAVGSLIFVIAFLGYCGALQVFRTMMVLMTMMMTMVKMMMMMMMMMMMFRKVVCYSQPMRSSSLSCSDSRSLPLYSLSFTRSSKR